MAIRVAVPKETVPGERRVALVPDVVARMVKQGYEVMVEKGAGEGAYYPDAAYEAAGAKLVEGKEALYPEADLILKIQPPSEEEVDLMKEGAVVVGFMQPHRYPERVKRLAERRVNAFALELIPRITRAQAMDVLSSQASVAGYKAGVLAADLAPKFFPMLTYAAGTIRPALVFVIGAGVAGLRSPPPSGWGRSSRPSTCAGPRASRCGAWGRVSWSLTSTPRPRAATPASSPRRRRKRSARWWPTPSPAPTW